MIVSDIMTKKVVSAKPEDNVIKVADLLQQKGFNGIPVVENEKILGMITEADLISRGESSLHIPSLIKVFHEFKLEKYVRGKKDANLQLILATRADTVMNTEFICVDSQTEVTDLIKLFQEKHVNPIPVVDDKRNLCGIVSLSDIIKLISRFREEELDFLSSDR